ncbi:MAG: plasmid pRiA4b ORF-3 family protein [Syntrophaceae bacterium]|nr:plasmid pRiA4b ORF-3 family protein [Syntrophaceae bacterium]
MLKERTISTYQFKITLRGSSPPIWRRFIVPDSITLPKMHQVIQIVMGWTDSHLHEFVVGGVSFGVPDPDYPSSPRNEARVRINQLLYNEKEKLLYLYDFGDGWEHLMTLEKIVIGDSASSKPRCLAGKRACPPEDCGGIYGYYALLEAIKDTDHPEHESMIEWVDGDIDPNYFDIDEVNMILSRFK